MPVGLAQDGNAGGACVGIGAVAVAFRDRADVGSEEAATAVVERCDRDGADPEESTAAADLRERDDVGSEGAATAGVDLRDVVGAVDEEAPTALSAGFKGLKRSNGSRPSRAGLMGCATAYSVSRAARRRLSRMLHASPSRPIALARPCWMATINDGALPSDWPAWVNHLGARCTRQLHARATASDQMCRIP